MANSKQKYYVVFRGVRPGIYETWENCKEQVQGYPGAQYKSYATLMEAQEAYAQGSIIPNKSIKRKASSSPKSKEPILVPSISVDAACSGNPGLLEYRGVWTDNATSEIFRIGPVQQGTNNIGEFLAIVHALALIHKNNWTTYPIYTDSMTAMAWVRKKKANTKLVMTKRNEVLFELIQRAEQWLHNHSYQSLILKWDTVHWGEIPADFGRK